MGMEFKAHCARSNVCAYKVAGYLIRIGVRVSRATVRNSRGSWEPSGVVKDAD
jgi:hypothetical protein